MPNTIQIKRCIRKEPITREDYLVHKLKKMGALPGVEKRVYNLPKAPGTFSLGPDHEPVQVPNSEVVQPVTDEFDVKNLESLKEGMSNLF